MKRLQKEKGPGDAATSSEGQAQYQHLKFRTRDSRAQGINAELMDLSRAVIRLNPCHRNPERYHEDKSVIAGRLRSLSRRIGEARHGG
jgi:hypothetical protein